jgi:hypothetical protein
MKYRIITCCKNKFENTPLQLSLAKLKINPIHITPFENNNEGLSYCYNLTLETWKKVNYDCLIFIHEDVEIIQSNFIEEIQEAFNQFDIVGLAGGLEPEIKVPSLWHRMCKRQNWRGRVGHFDEKGNKFITDFGETPSRVCVLDGLFLAVNLKKIKKTNWKFNETDCGKFHHYDIASSLDANTAGLKLGVWPILVYHHSPGLRDINDPTFQESQRKFLAKYS